MVLEKTPRTRNPKFIFDLLEDVEPLDFQYDILPYDETWDEESVWLEPWDVKTIPDDKASFLARRAAHENESGHFLNYENTLLCVRSAIGWNESALLKPIRWLKRYILDIGGTPQVFDRKRLLSMKGDLISGARFTTLVNAAFYEAGFGGSLDPKGWEEKVLFLFQNPHKNAGLLKGWMNRLRKAAFSMATGGKCMKYGVFNPSIRYPNLSHGYLADIEGNDKEFYEVQLSGLIEDKTALREAGLAATADELWNLINADVTKPNLQKLTALFGVIGITGFTRGYAPTAHYETLTEKHDVGRVPMTPYLADEWRSFVRWAHGERKIPTYKEFLARLPWIQTSRGAGGYKLRIEAEVKPRGDVRGGSNRLAFTHTSKRMIFMAHGLSLTTKKVISRGYYVDESKDDPKERDRYVGLIGVREVTEGKQPRAIFQRRIEHFIAESAFVIALSEQHFQDEEFTVGRQTGIPMQDHANLAIASSTKDVVIGDWDFRAFDTTQGEQNVRRTIREAFVDELKALGLTEKWGPWDDFGELIKTIWGPGITDGPVFKTGSGDRAKYITTNMLSSGEFDTLYANDKTNRAHTRSLHDAKHATRLGDTIKTVLNYYMGDDAEEFAIVNDSYTSAVLQTYLDLAVSVAKENGLDINKLKTNFRRFMGEYLKVRFTYGWQIPLLLVQPNGAERSPAALFPPSLIRSEAAKTATLAGRGWPEHLVERLLYFKWNVRRGIRAFTSKSVTTWHYLPFACMWTPTALQGVGAHWATIFGASKDSLIVYDLMTKEFAWLRELVEAAGGMLKAAKNSDLKSHLARKFVKGDTIPPNPFKQGIEDIRSMQIGERLSKSSKMVRKFPGYKHLSYLRAPENIVEESILSDPQYVALDDAAKVDSIGLMRAAAERGDTIDIDTVIPWLKSFRMELGAQLDHVQAEPSIPMLTGDAAEAARTYGSVGSPNSYAVSPIRLLSPLKKDIYWRRDISDEQLLTILIKPEFLGDPEKSADFLVMLGARPDLAREAAFNVTASAKTHIMSANALNFSMKGSDLTLGFDQTIDGFSRVVDMPDVAGDVFITNTIRSIAFYYSFLKGMETGVFRRVHVYMHPNGYAIATKALQGHKYYTEALFHNPIFSDSVWLNAENDLD
jgi:hypothetical protein